MTVRVVKTAAWNNILKQMLAMRGHVKVGVLASKGGSAEHEDSDLTLVELMAIHEFGTEDGVIEAREPMQTGIKDSMSEIKKLQTLLTKNIILGRITTKHALDTMGLKVAAMIRRRVKNGAHLQPALAQSTIDAKGSDRPLVDEGTLLNSITHEVSR